ncbi:MAG: TlpA family protein disulfide reductase [Granulosicoccus sp.]
MRQQVITIVIGLLCLLGSYSSHASNAPRTDGFDLSDYQGQVVYVDFWASWCPPCRASFPFMSELSLQYGDQLAIVAISVDENKSDADLFLESFETPFNIVYDTAGELAAQFNVPGMPTSYVYDRDGLLLHRHIGFRKSDQDAIRGLIESAISQ